MKRNLCLISSSVLLAVAANAQCYTATGNSVTAALVPTGAFAIDDEGRTPETLFNGFTFPMGGTNWTHYAIDTNGEIYLTDGSGIVLPALYGISSLTELRQGSPRIAAFGGDNQGVSGLVGWDILVDNSVAGQVKITWTGMRFFAGSQNFSFSLTLTSAGTIQFDYPAGQNWGTPDNEDYSGLSIGNNVGTGTETSSDLNLPGDTGTLGLIYQNAWAPFDLENQSILFVPNGTGGYTHDVSCRPATNTVFGVGCGGNPIGDGSFYEVFTASSFDLANTGFTMTWTGNGYVVIPGASAVVTPTGTALTIGDDQVVPLVLPSPFPGTQGLVTDVYLSSNGFLSFEATTLSDFSESVAELLSEETRLAFLWDDLNPGPSGGGTVHAEADAAGVFHITFTDVPEYPASGANNVQVSLNPNGDIEVKYGNLSIADCLVGFSSGNGATDPGASDLSTALPIIITTGSFAPALALSGGTTPVTGTNWDLITTNIDPVSPIAITFFGDRNPAPIALSVLGINAPGCDVNLLTVFGSAAAANVGGSATVTVPVPNLPSLVGVLLSAQSLGLSLANPANIVVSNGLEGSVSDV